MKNSIFALLFLFLSFGVLASWPSEVVKDMNSKAVLARELSNPVVATFWGGFKRFLYFPWNKGRIENLETSLFFNKTLPVYFSKSSNEKAPLYVFMPGIYGQPTRGLTPQFIDHLESLGGHVLVVPNILSPLYVEAYPLYQDDPSVLEVQAMEEALNYALNRLPEVRKVHVIAESLGSAIASAWVAHDRSHKRRLTDLTLLWPPLSLYSAMKNFDKMIHQYKDSDCSLMSKISVMGKKFLLESFPTNIDEDEEKCIAQILLIDGFIKAMDQSFETYKKVSKKSIDVENPKDFESFFKNYRPEIWRLLEKRDQSLGLAFWMEKIRKDKDFKVRIMTSENDFLNFGEDWSKFKSQFNLSDNELVILKWGGHSGPAAVAGFREHLRKTFE